MKKPEETHNEGCLGALMNEAMMLIGQVLIGPIFLGYFFVCFWFFDRFRVSDPDTQLAWVLAPVAMGGMAVVIHTIRKGE